MSQYSGRVWELHPLVVSRAHRMKGVGRMLVTDFEQQAAARGAITIVLGSDDGDGSTSFAGQDLYTEFPTQLANFEGNNHPTSFYMKLGYKIVGVIPDANGLGKPDISLAKRVR
ncbi:GNAT family N-acetyltransferase [Paenibacillus sp. E194]|uniref:GNAT family N-acetyltransferase n=1 Tax=Paenibacillus sp. E194 TaxID=1458845 RepID=UPI001E491138|nr:GNAT family N-acetyltransferase [Paenibacillus sp. E194]